jgi:tetratricopeptide (TPR) repeat protein
VNLPSWLPTPRTLAISGAALVAVLLLTGGAWFWYSASLERGQSLHAEALAQAATARGANANPAAADRAIAALDAALTQASQAPLAAQSAYALGDLRYEKREYGAARAAYGIALAKTSSATMRTLARAAIAATWEAERKFSDAVTVYEAAVADGEASAFYKEELLIGLARNQELAGRRDEAIQTYQRVLKDVPKAQLRRESEVRGRLASLGVAG